VPSPRPLLNLANLKVHHPPQQLATITNNNPTKHLAVRFSVRTAQLMTPRFHWIETGPSILIRRVAIIVVTQEPVRQHITGEGNYPSHYYRVDEPASNQQVYGESITGRQ
jgi:hypothetical protein